MTGHTRLVCLFFINSWSQLPPTPFQKNRVHHICETKKTVLAQNKLNNTQFYCKSSTENKRMNWNQHNSEPFNQSTVLQAKKIAVIKWVREIETISTAREEGCDHRDDSVERFTLLYNTIKTKTNHFFSQRILSRQKVSFYFRHRKYNITHCCCCQWDCELDQLEMDTMISSQQQPPYLQHLLDTNNTNNKKKKNSTESATRMSDNYDDHHHNVGIPIPSNQTVAMSISAYTTVEQEMDSPSEKKTPQTPPSINRRVLLLPKQESDLSQLDANDMYGHHNDDDHDDDHDDDDDDVVDDMMLFQSSFSSRNSKHSSSDGSTTLRRAAATPAPGTRFATTPPTSVELSVILKIQQQQQLKA